ncbi:epoxide hydrolase [Whalleya microplaca]|nr:epoxide hydrolase [Whalleya microplaca]
MAVDALVPNDPRVEHKFQSMGDDITYHYMIAKPKGTPAATVVLIHGWPDLGMGWRYQVPYLLSLNLKVIVPDMLGYGQTSAPDAVEEYTLKKMAGHVAAIIKENSDEPIILGGHDWGAALTWRIVMWHPELIRCVFSLCVPFTPPNPAKLSLEEVVKRMPNFTYQLQLVSPAAENIANASEARMRAFLNAAYDGRTPSGEGAVKVEVGFLEDRLDAIGQSPLFTDEVLDFYVREFRRHGLHGPCNWYRARLFNVDDEEVFTRDGRAPHTFDKPAMLVMAGKDAALPPRLAEGQEKYFTAGLKQGLVPGANHWIMTQYPEEVNQYIGDFLKSVLGDGLKASL